MIGGESAGGNTADWCRWKSKRLFVWCNAAIELFLMLDLEGAMVEKIRNGIINFPLPRSISWDFGAF